MTVARLLAGLRPIVCPTLVNVRHMRGVLFTTEVLTPVAAGQAQFTSPEAASTGEPFRETMQTETGAEVQAVKVIAETHPQNSMPGKTNRPGGVHESGEDLPLARRFPLSSKPKSARFPKGKVVTVLQAGGQAPPPYCFRFPSPGARDLFFGGARTFWYARTGSKAGEKPDVESIVIKQPGAKRGTRFIIYASAVAYFQRLAAEQGREVRHEL